MKLDKKFLKSPKNHQSRSFLGTVRLPEKYIFFKHNVRTLFLLPVDDVDTRCGDVRAGKEEPEGDRKFSLPMSTLFTFAPSVGVNFFGLELEQ